MFITNWLAKAEWGNGLAFISEFGNQKIRIYGNVYGHPKFTDGEYVQTAIVTSFDGTKVTTSCGESYTLLEEAPVYKSFVNASKQDVLVIKKWSVKNGLLMGYTLDGKPVSGKVISQSFKKNICTFKDGRRVFVDWLSKEPYFIPVRGPEEFFVFATEKCMPDIFGKHYTMFK